MPSAMRGQPLSSYDQSSYCPPLNYSIEVHHTFVHYVEEAQGKQRQTQSAPTQDVSELARQAQQQKPRKEKPESSDEEDEDSFSEKAEVSPKLQTEVQGKEAGAAITNAQGSVHAQHAAGPPQVSVEPSAMPARASIGGRGAGAAERPSQRGQEMAQPATSANEVSDEVWQKRWEKRIKWFPKFRTTENQNFEKNLPGHRRPPTPDPNDRSLSPADWEKQTAELRQYWAKIDVLRFLVQEVSKWKGVTNEQDRQCRQALLEDSENAWQEVTQEQEKPNKSGKKQKQAPITHDKFKELALAILCRKYFPLGAI